MAEHLELQVGDILWWNDPRVGKETSGKILSLNKKFRVWRVEPPFSGDNCLNETIYQLEDLETGEKNFIGRQSFVDRYGKRLERKTGSEE